MFSSLSLFGVDLSGLAKPLRLKSKIASSSGLLVCSGFLVYATCLAPLPLLAATEQNQIVDSPRILGALSEKDVAGKPEIAPAKEAPETPAKETTKKDAPPALATQNSLGVLPQKEVSAALPPVAPKLPLPSSTSEAPKPPQFSKTRAETGAPLPPPALVPPQITAQSEGTETLPMDVLKQATRANTAEPAKSTTAPKTAKETQVALGAPEKPLGTLSPQDLSPEPAAKQPKDNLRQSKMAETKNSPAPAAVESVKEQTSSQDFAAAAPKESAPSPRPVSFSKIMSSQQILSLDGLAAQQLQPDITEPLRLEEAVAFALKNNFDVQASAARTKVSRWEKIGAYSEMLPSLEYTYSKGKEHSHPASFNDSSGNRALDSEHFRQDRAFTARQPLIDLSIVADILKSSKAKEVADADDFDAKETVAIDTINVFLKLVQARITIHLADQYKGYLQNLMTRMQNRVEGGGATSADLDRIRSRFTIADAARLEALGNYGISLTEFRRLTKITPSRFEIPDQLAPETPLQPQEALEQAVKMNPSYQSSLKKIDVAQADRNRSVAGLAPKLSLEYANIHSENAGGAKKGNPIDGLYPKQKDSRFMMVARWSMNGGTAVAQGFAGTEKMREMNFRAQEVRARLEQAIFTGYDALGSARKRLAILSETLETDRRVVRDFEEQYAQGGRSLFDVLDAYERRHNTQLEIMRTMIGEAQASYQIRRQMGDLSRALVRPAEEITGR